MEARKITIISTRSNKRTVINTDATTLGELKRALREAGVDYDGMTFYEGLTKTELKLDESILPHDVQRINPTTKEPETTNELAFMLTNTNKKIRSGAATMSRTEAYNAIKALGLQAECQKRFGKNFTMCKTADLISLVESQTASKPAVPEAEIQTGFAKTETVADAEPVATVDAGAREAIRRIANFLYHSDTIECQDELNNILEPISSESSATTLTETGDYKPSSGSPYSDDELDDMFKDMPK